MMAIILGLAGKMSQNLSWEGSFGSQLLAEISLLEAQAAQHAQPSELVPEPSLEPG